MARRRYKEVLGQRLTVSRIELGYSYELGSGWTRIRVLTRPRKRSGTVMTVPIYRCLLVTVYTHLYLIHI